MYRNKKISIIIPTRNEVEGVQKIMSQVPSFVDEVLIVDCSDDETPKLAAKLGAKVVHEVRRGYGRAYKTGLKIAKGDIFVTMDSDGTYPVVEKELAPLLDIFINEDIDFLTASRFPIELDPAVMSPIRNVGNHIMTFFGNLIFGTRLKDYLSGMWILKPGILKNFILMSDDWSFSEEIKVEAVINKVKFKEVHIPYRARVGRATLVDYAYTQWQVGFLNLIYFVRKRWFRKLTWGFEKPEVF
jgi:dolichol-phosphate hexosyltransferase